MIRFHEHGPAIVECASCGEQRWCGIGPCRACGAITPCPLWAMSEPSEPDHTNGSIDA
jgi:hypothetical protein